MKHFVVAVLSAVVLFSCNPRGETSSTSNDSTSTVAVDMPFDTLITFCNWNEVGVRDNPSDKGKYVTTIYLGEELILPGDSAFEETSGKKNLFRKVRLSDGKEGWVRNEFLGINVVPGVITQQTSIYLRPDEAAVSDKKFEFLDVVAVKPSKGNWVEVKGKPAGGTWFQAGFIHLGPALSVNKLDAEFAFRYARAMAAKDPAAVELRINQIRDDAYLQKSDMYAMAFPDPDVDSDEDAGADGDHNASEAIVYTFSGTTDDLINHRALFVENSDGKPNSAVYFDGDSYIEGDNQPTEDASYCFWINPDKAQDGVAFIIGNACTSGYAISLADDKKGGVLAAVLCGGVNGNVTNSQYSIPLGKWVHLCLVKQGNDFTMMVDGKISSTGTSAFNPANEGMTFGGTWGCNPTERKGSFYGTMDELFIADYAIDEDRALQLRSGNFH